MNTGINEVQTGSRTFEGPIIAQSGANPVHLYPGGALLGEVWFTSTQWAVTTYGIQRRDGRYLVGKDALLLQMTEDYSWMREIHVDSPEEADDFAACFFVACAMHGHRISEQQRLSLMHHVTKARQFAAAVAAHHSSH